MRLILSIFAAALFLAGVSYAADQGVVSKCAITEEKKDPRAHCDIRLLTPVQVKKATILARDKPLVGSTFNSFEDGDGKAAWFFLIDRSNPARSATVKRSIFLVKSLYAQANARNIMAVGTFAEDLRVIISPGDPYADFDSRFANVKADGAATAFFFTAIKAIDILKKVPAERRALVLISDGKAEDTAYSREDVVKHAKQAGVLIYGIGIAEKRSETVFLQEVERLASETDGPFVSSVGNQEFPPDFIANFSRYLTNGGQVTAPLGTLSGEMTIAPHLTLVDGTTIEGENTRAFVAPQPIPEPEPAPAPAPPPAPAEAAPPPPEPLPFIAKIYAAFDPILAGSGDWAADNENFAWMLLLGIPLLIAGIFAVLVLRNAKQPATPDTAAVEDGTDNLETPYTQPMRADENPSLLLPSGVSFGIFEAMDGSDLRFEIKERNITIGRHSENDFQLEDDSVHRHHAVFHMLPGQSPIITDLDTVNGVVVNGQRVAKAELRSGDVISLGETSFRFVAIEH
jgi:hypothetical protein